MIENLVMELINKDTIAQILDVINLNAIYINKLYIIRSLIK